MQTPTIHNFFHRWRPFILFLFVFLILGIGTFLRLYRLENFAMFLGDQGRDAIVLKRLITLEHLPALGASTSIGQIYMGPFYYYLVAPWLLVTNFNPVGAALGVAIISIIGLLIQYYVVKRPLGLSASLIALLLTVFSSALIDFSRFSWNPNLLPLSSFLTWFSIYKTTKGHKLRWYFMTGIFFAICLQLHYLSIFLTPAIALYVLWGIEKRKESYIHYGTRIISLAGGFTLFSLPLILFELKHQFLNIKAILSLSSSQGTVGSSYIQSFFDTFQSLNLYIFHISLSPILSSLLIVGLVALAMTSLRDSKHKAFVTLNVFFFSLLVGTALYGGAKYPHYLGSMYIIYFCIIGYVLVSLLQSWITRILLIFFICIYILVQIPSMSFLTQSDQNQIGRSKIIAEAIIPQITSKKFTITTLPNRYSDSTYRYFLEIGGKRPIDKDSYDKADELFVLCEQACKPIGSSEWDIAYFAPTLIQWQKEIDGITIYKLIR